MSLSMQHAATSDHSHPVPAVSATAAAGGIEAAPAAAATAAAAAAAAGIEAAVNAQRTAVAASAEIAAFPSVGMILLRDCDLGPNLA